MDGVDFVNGGAIGYVPPELEPEPRPERQWPAPLEQAAYHGLLGDITATVEEHTEADPAGILASLLVMTGVACGRGRSLYQGARQRARLYVVLVGETGSGRKGTGTGVAADVLEAAGDPLSGLRASGIASGEAIVALYAQRQAEAEDAGNPLYDPRLLIVESEFSQLLAKMNREGSTLSQALRNGWDDAILGNFRSRVQQSIERHHMGLIGHITEADLVRHLTSTETANGFANRILFVAVRRPRILPFPEPPAKLAERYLNKLHRAVGRADEHRVLAWSASGRERWEAFYTVEAARPRVGLLGAVTGRHEVQALRIALVYAIVDGAEAVGPEHLEAGMAVAEYARETARYLFGESTGHPHADQLRKLIREERIGWEEAKRTLGLRTSADMAEAVGVLERLGHARIVREKLDRPGRPARYIESLEQTDT